MIDQIITYLEQKAREFGADNSNEVVKDYVLRRNIKPEAFQTGGAYFGFIHPEEEPSGPYHDFSFVVFPSSPGDEDAKYWVVCLGIGSLGFKNDFELATYPGVRRLFQSIMKEEDSFCKTDFSDIETSLPKFFLQNEKIVSIRKTLDTYKKVLPACQIIEKPQIDEHGDIIENESIDYLVGFLAAYAKLRNWASNDRHRKAIAESISKIKRPIETLSRDDIKNVLLQRKYLIMEGAPGTGKTRMAHLLAQDLNVQTFFTQFHAETSYSDFIWGIRPKLNAENIAYEEVKGKFVEALEYALQNSDENILLIIDEINRANLSNILGPIFYLFEYQRTNSDIKIEITPDLKLSTLPDNFYVVATMNTADRSLAVVDFALRRRFAWLTFYPMSIPRRDLPNGYKFYKKDFERFDDIFKWYASSNELNLQPGQAYFIARDDGEMKNRITYELFPLIKEYLQEGLLLPAKEEFNAYFQNRIGKSLVE